MNTSETLQIIQLPKIPDLRGNLSFIQNYAQIPFAIRRCYWIYDVPGGQLRHGHAFRTGREVIIALSGSFDVVTTAPDGTEISFHLARGYYGLYVPPRTWRRLDNFSTNSVALVLSSTLYDEADYIYDFQEYAAIGKGCDAGIEEEEIILPEFPETDPHATSSLADCRIVSLPRVRHPNGSLTFVENRGDALLPVSRVFYLYDVPVDSSRGGHSHFRSREFIVAASGCFDVTLSDGKDKRTFTLRHPSQALYVPTGIWRSLDNFSSGSVSLVLTTHPYSEQDYVRSWEEFLRRTAGK